MHFVLVKADNPVTDRYSTFRRILELVKIAVVPLTSNLHVFHSDLQNVVTYVYLPPVNMMSLPMHYLL